LWGTCIAFSKCINLHSYQQCTRVPFSPHPCQYLCFCLFDNSHSNSIRWHLIKGLICISLITSDIEPLSFICWPFECLLLRNIYLGLWLFKFYLFIYCCAGDQIQGFTHVRQTLYHWPTAPAHHHFLLGYLVGFICLGFFVIELLEFLPYFDY
jgi:hypothetical protein